MKLDRLLLPFFPSHDIHTQYSSHWAPFKYVISRHCSAPTFQRYPTPQSLSNGRLVKVLTFLPSCMTFLHDLSGLRTMVMLSLSPGPDWSMEMSHTPQLQSFITGFALPALSILLRYNAQFNPPSGHCPNTSEWSYLDHSLWNCISSLHFWSLFALFCTALTIFLNRTTSLFLHGTANRAVIQFSVLCALSVFPTSL